MHTPAAARAICFGPFQVDPRTHELRKRGIRIRVPQQSIRILLALLDRAGDVVSRDELVAILWPGETGVDIEHGLNSAVRRLRDSLGDSAERPVFVETVPRVGYRFIGSVETPAATVTAITPFEREATTASGPAAPELGRKSLPEGAITSVRARGWLLAVALVLITVTATVVWWRAKQTDNVGGSARTTPIPLTFEGGLQTDPRFSPDGQWLAYASDSSGNFDIWIRPLAGGDPVQLTNDEAADYQPDWSPDGTRLVFRSERAGGGLFVVPRSGGAAERISDAGFRPRWSPDGRQILFAKVVVTGLNLRLQVMDARGGSTQRGPEASSGAFGWQPRSSTVLTLASLSGPFDPNLFSWNVGEPSAKRWMVADEVNRGFRQERLVVVGGEDLVPSADMSALYFIGSARGTRALWQIGIDASTRQIVSGPTRVTTLPEASNASVSPDGSRVVFDGAARNAQIWSYPLDPKDGSDAAPVAMTSEAAHADFPTLSRDGQVFAFVLTRPGSPDRSELVARLRGQSRERTLRVIEEPREILGMPRWNDPGTMLAYGLVSNMVGESAPRQQVRLIDASTGTDTPLTSLHSPDIAMEFPTGWTPDGRHLLVTTLMSAPAQATIALVPIAAAPVAERSQQLLTSAVGVSLSGAVMSPDARWVAFRVGNLEGKASRIAVVPATGGDSAAWTFVTSGMEPADKPCWSDDGRTLYFTLGGSTVMNVWGLRFDPVAGRPVGEPFRITKFAGPGTHILPDIRNLELGIGGGRLVLPVVKPKGSLWLFELRTP